MRSSSNKSTQIINYHKLQYLTCWQYLSSLPQNTSLPAFGSISYLMHNTKIKQRKEELHYLTHLMDKFGLILIHSKYIYARWNNIDLCILLRIHSKRMHDIKRIISRNHIKDLNFLMMLNIRFIQKLLHDVNSTNLRCFIQSASAEVGIFTTSLCTSLYYLYRTYDQYDGTYINNMDVIISHLMQNDALNVLGFMALYHLYILQDYNIVTSAADFNGFIALLLSRIISCSTNMLDVAKRERVNSILCGSAYLWHTGDAIGSMGLIVELSENDLFDPLMLQHIDKIFHKCITLPKNKEFLHDVLITLCNKRLDWNFASISEESMIAMGFSNF